MRLPLALAALSLAGTLVASRPAAADDLAPWLAPRVLSVPTAWVRPTTVVVGSLDGDQRRGSGARATLSYAHLVEFDVGGDGLLTACDPCGGDGRRATAVQQTTAGWKLGHQVRPELAIGGGVRVPFGYNAGHRAVTAFAIASWRVGRAVLHGGVSTWASEHRGGDGRAIELRPSRAVRPLLGFEWTPPIYPRTTLTTDLQWLPEHGPTAADTGARWSFMWGVRYRTLPWSAIELAVRHRQGDELGGATVMVRLTAVLSSHPL